MFDRYEAEDDVEKVHEARIRRCRSCNEQIVWFKTSAGNNMPVNESTVEAEGDAYDPPRHVSHFATCPNSDKHRKPR